MYLLLCRRYNRYYYKATARNDDVSDASSSKKLMTLTQSLTDCIISLCDVRPRAWQRPKCAADGATTAADNVNWHLGHPRDR